MRTVTYGAACSLDGFIAAADTSVDWLHFSPDVSAIMNAYSAKGICVMGGGDFARSLFAAGAIDEVGLNIHPILLGSGIPFFLDTGQRIGLELAECRQIGGGCLYVLYRVRH